MPATRLSPAIFCAQQEAGEKLQSLQPLAVISIERPGLAVDGRYYNMRGEDISERCFFFDPFINLATCPTIGIGDGVTGQNTLTEDGLAVREGIHIIAALRKLTNFTDNRPLDDGTLTAFCVTMSN